jgi:heme-degrading monooxygenase HmoA
MFCVFFEVRPRDGQGDAYLDIAAAMRKQVQAIDGFLDVERFRDLSRPGAFLSFSTWRTEKALIRWRVDARHHVVQMRGRTDIFDSYRIRIGELTADSAADAPPAQFRYDETETGAAKRVAITEHATGKTVAAPGALSTVTFDSVMREGHSATLTGWADEATASALTSPAEARTRHFRIVRDYTMVDRHEAPQYFPAVALV